MPISWKKGENPYRINYFGILAVGANAHPRTIPAMRKNLIQKIQAAKYCIGNRQISEAEVYEAESRILDEKSRASEMLLVHPVPQTATKRLNDICESILKETTPARDESKLELGNLKALLPLVPSINPEDIPWPEWEEFGIPGPDSEEQLNDDIQFDL